MNETTQTQENEIVCGYNYIKSGRKHLSSGEFAKAVESLDKALEINPDLVSPYYKKAMALYLQQNFDAAEELWNIAWDKEWQK